MVERIRDSTVAEAIAAEAGTDATPELVLGEVVTPTLQLQPRPPLAVSGYLPGTIGIKVPAVALNTGHGGIFIRGRAPGPVIGRVNWCMIMHSEAATRVYSLRRVDSPFTGFPSTRAVPGYSNAGPQETGSVFSVIKNDTVAAVGDLLAAFEMLAGDPPLFIPGPWILNDGMLLISENTVNKEFRVAFGYETWPAIRVQPVG